MSDQDTSLPVRSEADGTDERLQTKIVDSTNPDSQQVEVDTDKNLHVEVHGDDPAGGDETLRLSELGAVNGDGDYDATTNTKPASGGLIAHDRAAAPAETEQNVRLTGVAGEDDTHCLDVAIRDESGAAFDADNPMPVSFEENEGDEIHDFKAASSVAKDAEDDHIFSVADGKTLLLFGVHIRASGKMKAELIIGDGAATEVFVSKDVSFNSTAKPDGDMDFYRVPIKIVGTVNTTTIKLTLTNKDKQAQDLYSTLIGIERNT